MPNHPNIDHSIEVAAVFRTLSDPFRLHILALLIESSSSQREDSSERNLDLGETVDKVAYTINIAPNLAEQHIMELSRARLVSISDDSAGRPCIVVNTELLEKVRGLVGSHIALDGESDTEV